MNALRSGVAMVRTAALRLVVVVPPSPASTTTRCCLLRPHASMNHASINNNTNLLQVRTMSKYLSKSAKKRLTLTTKRARKGFYKGNGATKEGRFTSKGRFVVDKLKQLELIVPDLTGFKLKPYIAVNASKFPPEQRRTPGPR